MEKKYIDVKPIIEAMIEHFNTLKTKAEIEYPEEIYGERRFASDPQFAGPAACVKFWADKLAKEPAADVQEVRHGKWTQIGEKIGECSACGNKTSTRGADHTGRALILTATYKYCPSCGAKMDGGGK